ncbi:MAG: restriction endonuclease [Hyphomicrobiales bacterium]|nr:restriction endonuclease [Hyphomicrobiales bacterium]
MAIPTYQDIMRPLLEYLNGAGGSMELSPLREGLVKKFPEMTSEELEDYLGNGEKRFFNRVRWAVAHLKRAGFLCALKIAHYEITKTGRSAIATKAKIDRSYLMKHSKEYNESMQKSVGKSKQSVKTFKTQSDLFGDEITPEEEIDAAIERSNNALEAELLIQAREMSSGGFERLAVYLLLAMGYGSSGDVVGGSGDEGIDGIVRQDKLGVDKIYVQTKRYKRERRVQPKEIREFSGSLNEKMQKGIFFTTSSFTKGARQAAEKAPRSIVLIDGDQLAKLMFDYNVGCNSRERTLKSIEEEFFRRNS